MTSVDKQQWGEVIEYTWSQLEPYKWMDFRLALMDTETEQTVQGVSVEQSFTAYTVATELKATGVNIIQSPVIMDTKTEMITNIVVSDRDYLNSMIEYLPLYERKSNVFNEILKSYDRELRNNEQSLEVVNRNLFLDTAIEYLNIYERDLGININKSLTYDQRREQISSRYRASLDQTTEETIKNVANAYSNGEVEVSRTDTPGLYEIKFVGTRGIPNNLDGLKKALDIIIPAHLGVTYTFTFNTWEFLNKKTWGEASVNTWSDLREWNEVS